MQNEIPKGYIHTRALAHAQIAFVCATCASFAFVAAFRH